MSNYRRIALIGFSGSGKSTVAQVLAKRLGWQAIDLDAQLEQTFGMTVPEVFEHHGEPAFRHAERAALLRALDRDRVVIATGGGAVVDPGLWSPECLSAPDTLTVTLDAEPATMLERMQQQQIAQGTAATRPMIAGDRPVDRIVALKAVRQDTYDRSAITLIADNVTPEELAGEIVALVHLTRDSPRRVVLEAISGKSEILIAPGVLATLGKEIRGRWPKAQRVFIVTDQNVGALHLAKAVDPVSASELTALTYQVDPGEGSKSLGTASALYDWLLGERIERNDVIVALGGGVIGDLAGFVAATVLRGVGLVQVPTSLLAMVDSSVGGKTGVNHAAGKNLIGSFYQPPLVMVDTEILETLPPRELRQGWAEIVKHAAIQQSTPGGARADLTRFLVRNAEGLLALGQPALDYLVGRNIELKARVVEADEREAGIRALLNFGHTLGHAIEASDYRYLHGEAVALGMRAAARLSLLVGIADPTEVKRLDNLLSRFGLPEKSEANADRVLQLLGSDKKRVAGRQQWVLLDQNRGVSIQSGIPTRTIAEALESISVSPVGR